LTFSQLSLFIDGALDILQRAVGSLFRTRMLAQRMETLVTLPNPGTDEGDD